jgi:26 proteasome complex subunit DSS1
MSGAAQGSAATTKAATDDKSKNGEPAAEKKPAAQLEEDDEFEDFPAEGTRNPEKAQREDAKTLGTVC